MTISNLQRNQIRSKDSPARVTVHRLTHLDIKRALAYAKLNKKDATTYYIKGIVSQVDEVSLQYGNARYYLSDDGTTANQLMVFRGFYLNGEKFTDASQISTGKKVVILGTLDYYEATSTPQVGKGSKIISIN